MKKARTVVTVMIVLAAVLLGLHSCRPKYRYDVWKDSHEVYGDAEYQLMTDPDHSYSLYNHAISHTMLNDVEQYQNLGKFAYFYGKSPASWMEKAGLFAILNAETNALQYVLDEDSAPSVQREQMEEFVGKYCSDRAVTITSLSELSDEEQSILLQLRDKE